MLMRLLAATLAASGLMCAADFSCKLVPGWAQKGEARSYVADNLFEYMDGNAEGYLLYGFQSMHGLTCVKGTTEFVVDISDFGNDDNAFGMFSANRDPRQPQSKIGAGGQIVPRRAIFVKGKYYLEVAANPEGDFTKDLDAWTAALASSVEGTSEPPVALQWFPAEKQQSLRLVPESVLGIRLLKRGYAGQYDYGKAFVVAEESPATAGVVMDKLRQRFGETTKAEVADDAFQANDRYLGRLCVFRKGSYVAGYANVAEGQDPLALAKSLAARLP